MKISQPFVLLLGGLLSASGIGCSAITAVVTDYRPAPRDKRDGSAERMVAIGRVFENQGHFDKAEVLYRRALKQNPNDPAIRGQLQQLADRRTGRQFNADRVTSAIALADSVSTPDKAPRHSTKPKAEPVETSPPITAAVPGIVVAVAAGEVVPKVEFAAATSASPTIVVAETFDDSQSIADAETSTAVTDKDTEIVTDNVKDTVTADEILAVIDESADHPDLLMRGLQFGDSPETQCLAATLLGDCAADHTQVRAALAEAAGSTADDRLQLAIAASRIQRGETDDSTARTLIALLGSGDDDTRIQAVAELRHFGGTESHDECVTALRQLLTTDSHNVRAIAAVTLGDFPHIDPETCNQLRALATDDESPEVRDAASAAVGRGERQGAGTTQAMILTPR